jgi:hypothetical protein
MKAALDLRGGFERRGDAPTLCAMKGRAIGKHQYRIGQNLICARVSAMSIPSNQHLTAALSRDLRPPGSRELIKVSDDSARKVFTANKDGAVWVFAHNQPDPAFWVGKKHYGSGPSSRVRMPRKQAVIEE